jgi:hypothetical protein
MCHYITAVLPKSAPHEQLDAIARRHGRQFQPLSTPSITSQIEPDERYFFTTLGHCDCGTPLGALARPGGEPDWPAQEQRLLRKGWSKARAARSISQKQEDYRAAAESSADAGVTATSSWLAFIDAVLDSGKTTHLGLLLHMYSGALEARIALEGRETVRSGALTAETLGHMREDVLYVFRR